MKDETEYFKRLAQRARQEHVPRGDVRGKVLARLREEEAPLVKPMLVFAAGYTALASAALIWGIMLLDTMQDPLVNVMQVSSVIMP